MLLVTSLLFRFSDFHRESEQTSSKLHATRAYRGSAPPRRVIISCRVAISNADIELACSNLSRTDVEGLNSLNWMPWSRVHCCKYTSMPRPPPPKTYTSERSSTTIRASPCEVTASRNLKAASLPTILPSHSTTAKSLMLSICALSMTSSQRCSVALKHEPCHRFASCILCRIGG